MYQESLAVLGSESFSSSQEVTVALNFISLNIVLQ
jgi:hypothetical protein